MPHRVQGDRRPSLLVPKVGVCCLSRSGGRGGSPAAARVTDSRNSCDRTHGPASISAESRACGRGAGAGRARRLCVRGPERCRRLPGARSTPVPLPFGPRLSGIPSLATEGIVTQENEQLGSRPS